MAQTDPVYITFEFRGDLNKEIDKLTLGIIGLRDEAATTYKRLIADSSTAYNAMSTESRKLATTMQQNINSLRSLASIQEQLDRELNAGTIALSQYTQAKAALALQENQLRVEISQGMQQLQQQMATEQQASDSVVALTRKLRDLTTAYNEMSKMDREGTAGKEILKKIQSVDEELQTAQTRLAAYSRTAGGSFNGLQMSIQQVARELPSFTMGANMFFMAISNNLPILVDNISMARREYQAAVRAGQQATPVWKQVLGGIVSWQTALVVGITLLTVYGKEITNWIGSLFSAKKQLADTLETLEEFQEAVAKSSSTTLTQLQKMSAEWLKLGDNMEAKQQYIVNNRTEIDRLGVSIDSVTDAESLFNSNKDKFVASLMARARAAASLNMATEKYAEFLQQQTKVDAMPDKVEYSHFEGGIFDGKWVKGQAVNLDKVDAQKKADELLHDAMVIINKAVEYSEEERTILEKSNLKSIRAIEAGSVGAIKASIAAKEAALNKLTNKKDYEKAIKEIEEEKKKLEAIIGTTGVSAAGKEVAPFGSIAYYNELIAKLQKMRDLATTDEERSAFAQQLKEYEEKVAEMENRIILSGKEIVMETLQSSLEGVKITNLKIDDRLDIEKLFGKIDTSDLESLINQLQQVEQYGESLSEDYIYQCLDGLYDITSAVGGINEELAETMHEVQQLIDAVGMFASGNYAGAAISVITTIVSSIVRKNQETIAFAKEAEASYWDAVNWKIERQISLMKELGNISSNQTTLIIQNQIDDLFTQLTNIDLDIKIKNLKKFYELIDLGLLSAVEKGDEFAFEFLKGFYDGVQKGDVDGHWNYRFYDVLKNLSKEEIVSLQGIPEIWRILPDEIQEYIKKLSDAIEKQDELKENIKETYTGTNKNAIANTILQGFAEGKRSAKDFANDFQKMLNEAVLQGVKIKALEEPLRKWYESFAAASQNGLTADSIASLKAQYDKIIEDAGKQLEEMEKVTGTTIGDITDAGRTATAKGIASMNQDSADELNGNFYALLIYADRTSQGVTSIQGQLVEGLSLLQRIASNTDRLEIIEKDIRQTRSTLQNIENRGLILRKQ